MNNKRRLGWSLMSLAAIGVAAVVTIPYLSLDPARSRVAINPSFSLHFPLLLIHIFLAAIVLLIGPYSFWILCG